MLEVLPIGVVVLAGAGIQDNLADKARRLGIPVLDFRKGGTSRAVYPGPALHLVALVQPPSSLRPHHPGGRTSSTSSSFDRLKQAAGVSGKPRSSKSSGR